MVELEFFGVVSDGFGVQIAVFANLVDLMSDGAVLV